MTQTDENVFETAIEHHLTTAGRYDRGDANAQEGAISTTRAQPLIPETTYALQCPMPVLLSSYESPELQFARQVAKALTSASSCAKRRNPFRPGRLPVDAPKHPLSFGQLDWWDALEVVPFEDVHGEDRNEIHPEAL